MKIHKYLKKKKKKGRTKIKNVTSMKPNKLFNLENKTKEQLTLKNKWLSFPI